MSGPSAGEYDPRKATFYSPVRGTLPNGEPDITSYHPEFTRPLRWLSAAGREGTLQQQTTGVTIVVFRVRRDSKTERIGIDWELDHKTMGTLQRYGITSINPLDKGTGEFEFVARGIRKVT